MDQQYNTPENTLPEDILKTVAYFDLFDYPMTVDQIFSYLPRNSVSKTEVARISEQLVKERKLLREHDVLFLSSSNVSITVQRKEDEKRALRMLSYARIIAMMIKQVPFVRGIFITGSLSKVAAGKGSDIDFMIVTSSKRLWIVRSMLTLFRKIFLFGNKKYLCTNYYVTENGFSLDRRNLYTAIEVVTTKVLWNPDALMEFRRVNSWTKKLLPNMSESIETQLVISSARSPLQGTVEFLLNMLPMEFFDRRLMEFHRSHWNTAFRYVPNHQRETMFIVSPDVSACWPGDRQKLILSLYQEKLSALGLQ